MVDWLDYRLNRAIQLSKTAVHFVPRKEDLGQEHYIVSTSVRTLGHFSIHGVLPVSSRDKLTQVFCYNLPSKQSLIVLIISI